MKKFIFSFLMLLTMFPCESNGQSALNDTSCPIAYFTDSSIGAFLVDNNSENTIPSKDGYIELILSPEERLTFIDGNLFSYTFVQLRKIKKQRATLSNEHITDFGVDTWGLRASTWFQKCSTKEAKLISIDGKKTSILYDKNTKNLTIRIH